MHLLLKLTRKAWKQKNPRAMIQTTQMLGQKRKPLRRARDLRKIQQKLHRRRKEKSPPPMGKRPLASDEDRVLSSLCFCIFLLAVSSLSFVCSSVRNLIRQYYTRLRDEIIFWRLSTTSIYEDIHSIILYQATDCCGQLYITVEGIEVSDRVKSWLSINIKYKSRYFSTKMRIRRFPPMEF
jgi:hypothetical protein